MIQNSFIFHNQPKFIANERKFKATPRQSFHQWIDYQKNCSLIKRKKRVHLERIVCNVEADAETQSLQKLLHVCCCCNRQNIINASSSRFKNVFPSQNLEPVDQLYRCSSRDTLLYIPVNDVCLFVMLAAMITNGFS